MASVELLKEVPELLTEVLVVASSRVTVVDVIGLTMEGFCLDM
jgi:hypothetical protein